MDDPTHTRHCLLTWPFSSHQVKYSNDNSIDFFVYGRGHGQDIAIASFKGLQINLEPLDSIEISEDGESVFLQAGLDIGHVIRALWEEGLHVSK